MYRTEVFPQEIMDRHQGDNVLIHGRLASHRNDGCWFISIKLRDSIRMIIYSPFPGHEVVDSVTLPDDASTLWLESRADY